MNALASMVATTVEDPQRSKLMDPGVIPADDSERGNNVADRHREEIKAPDQGCDAPVA